MKTSMEKADFVLRLLTFLALVAGGLWAIYQYKLAASDKSGHWESIVLNTGGRGGDIRDFFATGAAPPKS